MRDDVIYAIAPVEYRDAPVVSDGNILTCRETANLPQFVRTLIAEYGRREPEEGD
jgi:putative intracellular protease/amidase